LTSVVHSFKESAICLSPLFSNLRTPHPTNPIPYIKIKMRFSIFAAAAFLATAIYADEVTVYSTDEITVTSCAATVTNCPARSTVTYTTSYPVVTSSAHYSNSSTSTSKAAGVPASSSSVLLSTITISTCVPTVIYSTITVSPTTKAAPSSTGTISYSHNVTAPAATASPTQFTGSASSVQGSIVVAAFAGLAAFVFA